MVSAFKAGSIRLDASRIPAARRPVPPLQKLEALARHCHRTSNFKNQSVKPKNRATRNWIMSQFGELQFSSIFCLGPIMVACPYLVMSKIAHKKEGNNFGYMLRWPQSLYAYYKEPDVDSQFF